LEKIVYKARTHIQLRWAIRWAIGGLLSKKVGVSSLFGKVKKPSKTTITKTPLANKVRNDSYKTINIAGDL
jgi:hypothetical protein